MADSVGDKVFNKVVADQNASLAVRPGVKSLDSFTKEIADLHARVSQNGARSNDMNLTPVSHGVAAQFGHAARQVASSASQIRPEAAATRSVDVEIEANNMANSLEAKKPEEPGIKR